MRRTLWVVPRELVEVVHAACTRTRRRARAPAARRVRRRRAASRRTPAAWLDELGAAALRALEARGEAFTADLSRDDPLLATKLRLGAGTRWETEVERRGAHPAAARRGGAARARPSPRRLDTRPVPVGRGGRVARRRSSPRSTRRPLRRSCSAAGSTRSARRRRPTSAGGRAGRLREARAALAAVPHALVELDGVTGYVLADDVDPPAGARPWVALLPTLDPTTMGWKERAWYIGPHERRAVRLERQRRARPCGATAASSAAGRSERTARSSSACSRTSAPRPSDGGRGRGGAAPRVARGRPVLAGLPAAVPAIAGRLTSYAPPRKISFAITSRWICEVPS